MGDIVGHAFVPRAEEVHGAGLTHHHTGRTERPGAGDPQLRRTGDVTDIGLPAEDQNIEIVRRHLVERPLATPRAQGALVRANFN
ncbi:hypothetical protein MMARJ_43440 [Mycobacterium marseillense]|uniref:Uncharacterized protein n=1 Tax=Mycobacterium marseillense TaxID=701042 RepID=A0ABN5ZYF7_9MYCO|nr:hypothetical protein MMARJ_43440 [Mycobacterium marseillense]